MTPLRNTFQNHQTDKEKDWFQILAILIVCITSFLSGISFSWTSPAIPRIVEDKVNYNITMDETSYFTVIAPLGNIFSCLIYSKLLDIIGPKWTVYSIIVPQMALWISTAAAKSVSVFYMARFFSGIADACLFASVPVYIGEISTPNVRGTWGNCMSLFIYIGEFSINVIGSYTSIQGSSYICLAILLLFMCLFPFMPESPYYLLMKNRKEEAGSALKRLRRKHNVDRELQLMQSDVNRQMSESGTWKDLFTIHSNRKAIIAGIFLRSSQQLGGHGTFLMYTQYIFLKSGGNLSANTSSMIFVGLYAILNICAIFTLDRLGRRRSYMYSCLFCGILLLAESVYFFLEDHYPTINVTIFNWTPVAGMIGYAVFDSFGLGIVPTLMLSELFSNSIKGKALCLMNICFSILLSVITRIFYFLDSHFGLFSSFLLFSISCLLSTVLSFYFVPETKGKTLEQIQQTLKGNENAQNKHSDESVET